MSKHVLILRHVAHESAGTVEIALKTAGVAFQYFDFFARQTPDFDVSRLLGLIVMGGPMNVDETHKYPYLVHELNWIRQAIEAGLPVLGICLGSQLIAKALGSKVYRNHIKEIGWYPLELTAAAADDRLFAGCQAKQTVFQWHGDTFDLPDGAVHLARSLLCRNQAFRFGDNVYALQFHIEMTAEMIEDWLTESVNSRELKTVDYIDPHEIRKKTLQELSALQALAATVLGRFAALCK